MEKRQLNEAPKEGTKESENLKEEVIPSPKKTKFGRKATKDAKSICSSNK